MSRKNMMDYHNGYRSSPFHTFLSLIKVLGFILLYWCCSISLTFFNRHLFRDYEFPLAITTTHMAIKFIFAALIRWFLHRFCFRSCYTNTYGQQQNNDRDRVKLTWPILWRKVAPTGITAALDISLSNWSLQYITISLYVMCKSTVIIYILLFGIIFGLERFRCSLIGVVVLIACGLFLFTYHYTEFHAFGFLLVMVASFLSGLRWTITQLITQKHELGLSNPVDAMYYIQPWMLAVIIPLACFREGQHLLYELHLLNKKSFAHIWPYMSLVGSSALLAFSLEFSEFLLVSNTSSLTLSVSGIFKEVVMLYLAVEYNNNELNTINIIGLSICLTGIIFHCILKFYNIQKEKPVNNDSIVTERLLLHRLESTDEWSVDGEVNIRRTSVND
ncbi:hypothetical protein I4U23_008844 [Adineta vaga]|nr:hypothetical protein I4U23_008844 [Adineta vaga]